MKPVWLGVMLLSCQSVNNLETAAGVREHAQNEIFRDCIFNPARYGYPVDSVSDFHALQRLGLTVDPSPSTYCRRVAASHGR